VRSEHGNASGSGFRAADPYDQNFWFDLLWTGGSGQNQRNIGSTVPADLAAILGFANAATLMILAAGALLGGLVRGFTGFGFAMVFVPLATVAVGPVMAVALIFLMDLPFALVLAGQSMRRTEWREVIPLIAGATLLFPVGVWALTALDPKLVRWVVALAILLAVAVMATGWRYRGAPGVPLSLGVGGLSGVTSGAAQLGGMPLAVFWLSAQKNDPRQTKDNLNGYFAVMPAISGPMLWWAGVLSLASAKMALALCVPYGLGLLVGARAFHLASEQTFRRIAYAVIVAAAVLALPVLDTMFGR
jgi:uncharacterized protein